ncbi:MAG: LamB/YcsF family protein [Anaerolineales bacterium]
MGIDINCDMGESFGRFKVGDDQGVMPFITSANIACGMHAGDPMVVRATVRSARHHGVGIGAHPGWPDLQGFGRREMQFTAEDAEAFVLFQIAAVAGIAKAEGARLVHVKPHGALYNQATKDHELAQAIARAVREFDAELILVGLAGSALIEEGIQAGLRVANEGFADRRYESDGTLRPRKQTGAVIETPEGVATQAVQLAREGIRNGRDSLRIDTLCLHGDHPRAADNARRVRESLEKAGMAVERMTG